MNSRTTIATRQTGTRHVLGVDRPVETIVERRDSYGPRHWAVIEGLCDGVPRDTRRFRTRREALGYAGLELGEGLGTEPPPSLQWGSRPGATPGTRAGAQRRGDEAMNIAKEAHARWQRDGVFVAWNMRHLSATRKGVLALRDGMLDAYSGWTAGRQHGRLEAAAYLRDVAGGATGPSAPALLALASVLETPDAKLPQPGPEHYDSEEP